MDRLEVAEAENKRLTQQLRDATLQIASLETQISQETRRGETLQRQLHGYVGEGQAVNLAAPYAVMATVLLLGAITAHA